MPATISRPPTPILDLEKPLPKPKLVRWLRRGTPLLLVLLCVSAVFRAPSLIVLIFYVVPFVLLTWAATLVHELGHVVAGLLMRLRFNGITVGPFVCRRSRSGWRARLRPSLFGGYTYMSLDKVRQVRKRVAIFVLGGPVANLVTAISATVLFFVLFPGNGSSLAVLLLPLAFYAVLSFWIGIRNLLPSAKDGRMLRNLRGPRDDARRIIAAFALNLLKTKGIAPANWKPTWVAAAQRPSRRLRSELSSAIRNYRDGVGLWGAAQNLEYALANSAALDESNRASLIGEAAFFNAWSREDVDKARVWIERFTDLDSDNPLAHLRISIAFDCCTGNFDSALRNIDSAITIVRRLPSNLAPPWEKWREHVIDWMTCEANPASKEPILLSGAPARCPSCEWVPRRRDRWQCKCQTQWNTFETGGVCPTCREPWKKTQCLQCGEWSSQPEWAAVSLTRTPQSTA